MRQPKDQDSHVANARNVRRNPLKPIRSETMKKSDINIVKKREMINKECFYDSNIDNTYYSLDINEKNQLYSFNIDNKDLGKILLKLKGQIEMTLGYDKLKDSCDATKEELDQIVNYHVKNHEKCSTCDLKFDHCYKCVFDYETPLEKYLFREYKKRNIDDRDFKEDLEKIKDAHENFESCQGYCKFQNENCYDCILTCQSPLEQIFYLEALKRGLGSKIKLQMIITKEGKIYDDIDKVNKNNILTIPDFYLDKEDQKLCLYTDGFTYHERTEKQAIRDRNIDRELQKMGFEVMRYTTKEVRNNIEDIISSII
ncbi:uncharacterized protein DUF559 [Halanaerobium saccharolyticum]|jgi:hypothetical protein|uniref:Uncharacterized protein DUF559 n=2 Tax=Halanaerobium TaxID=2330 RepID=A0A4R6R582_9FIRM|nr:uncharacterized protein DUF559 [Halanaerobium saccharolyticum]